MKEIKKSENSKKSSRKSRSTCENNQDMPQVLTDFSTIFVPSGLARYFFKFIVLIKIHKKKLFTQDEKKNTSNQTNTASPP